MDEKQFEALMKVMVDIWVEMRDLRADLHKRDRRDREASQSARRRARSA